MPVGPVAAGDPHDAGEAWLSVQLHLTGRVAVVVGGGRVGTRRARQLCDAGSDVTVVARDPSDEIVSMAAADRLRVLRREFRPDDVDGAAMVVAATDDPLVNSAVQEAAEGRGALVNRADLARSGDVLFPAVVDVGPLRLTVSTQGDAPAVSRWAASEIAAGIERLLGLDEAAIGLLVEVVAEVRAETSGESVGESAVTPQPIDWRSAFDRTMLEEISRGRRAVAKERLKACLSSS